MNKLLSALLAGLAALALGGAALAAEQSGDTQSRDNQTEMQPNPTNGKPEQSDAQAQPEQSDSASNSSSQTGDQPIQADTSDAKGTAPQQSTVKGEDQSQGQASQAIPAGNAGDSNATQAGAEPNAKEQELTAALKKCDSLSGTQKQNCVDAAKKKSGEM